MYESLLVANRGEIARRVFKTAKRMGLRTIAIHSRADAELPFVAAADEAWEIPAASPAQTYRSPELILDIAKRAAAAAIHPGYGFLSEDASFAEQVLDAGIGWIGPPPTAMRAMADKVTARNLAARAGVPVAPGTSDAVTDADVAAAKASQIGYPLMVKAALGGGGIGMTVVRDEKQLRATFNAARDRAARMFASPDILLERFVDRARHVEIQVVGLPDGHSIVLGERECSVQRRNQKVIEESPSCIVDPFLRARMARSAVAIADAVGYQGVGTIECLVDPVTRDYYFLEMNTRLQVEHAVTEMVTGLDLVELQLLIADGTSPHIHSPTSSGHAIELRLYAEDPESFFPSPGTITDWREPTGDGIRVDAGYGPGNTVTPHYDPLLAKICVWGKDRNEALERGRQAVANFTVEGLKTNLRFLGQVLENGEFLSGDYDTGMVNRIKSSTSTPAGS